MSPTSTSTLTPGGGCVPIPTCPRAAILAPHPALQGPHLTGTKQSTGAGNSRTKGNLYFNKIVCAHAYIYTWEGDIYRAGGAIYIGRCGEEQQSLSLFHSFPLFGKGVRQVWGELSTEKRRQSALQGSQALGTAQTRRAAEVGDGESGPERLGWLGGSSHPGAAGGLERALLVLMEGTGGAVLTEPPCPSTAAGGPGAPQGWGGSAGLRQLWDLSAHPAASTSASSPCPGWGEMVRSPRTAVPTVPSPALHPHLHLHISTELQLKAAELIQDFFGGGGDMDLQGWGGKGHGWG